MLHAPSADRVRTKLPRRRPAIAESISSGDRDRLIRSFLQSLDCPRALTAWLLYSHGEHRQLVELTCDPHNYQDPDYFRRSYGATKFLVKATGLKTGIDLKKVAITSAVEAEVQCLLTNRRLRWLRSGAVRSPLHSVFFRAQSKIASILGPVPSSFEDFGWSKGRTTSSSGTYLSSVVKYASRLDVTRAALPYAIRHVRDSPLWGASVLNADGPCSVLEGAFNIVEGNVLFTVPKSAKTDRVICYEPHVNIRLQRMVGAYLQDRLLRKAGVNLRDQSINQRRAKLASKTGHLATIDLRSASDTLAFELVVELLPPDWVELLDDLRSKNTLWPDGTLQENHKFSSMGNGFTFELESLIFYALASSVSDNVSVFGDDIIVPSESFLAVKAVLEGSGFLINNQKSFHTSYFRESCGADAFSGLLCTPVYLRSLPKLREDVIKLHNQVRRWCSESIPLLEYERLLNRWRTSHPCPLGPSGFGDGHYHVDLDRACPTRAPHGWDAWQYHTYVKVFYDHGWLGGGLERGEIPADLGYAALCACTGPKSLSDVWASTSDRRQYKYKKLRLTTNSWSSEVWV
jgi:hypothetical protein